MKTEVVVKFLTRGSKADEESDFKKQTLNNEGKVGICTFSFNPLLEEYDWLVVIDDISRIIPKRIENLKCPKENTILITSEPGSITKYGKAFASQFNYIITNQDERDLPHNNAKRSQTGNIWFYGKDYNSIIKIKEPLKSKKLSTVCSNKQQGHTIHKLRFEFTKILEERIPELNRFGKGYNWIESKADALDQYEFHIAIENHYAADVWTEKLADAFLGYCVPIYYGCPNVYDYFPKDSLVLIDIYDIEGSIKKIQKLISSPCEYERRLPAVNEARRRVIEEYNILEMINTVVEKSEDNLFKENQKIYNRRIMRVKVPSEFLRFAFWKIKIFIKNFNK